MHHSTKQDPEDLGRHAVPDGSVQVGNAASVSPGGGEMTAAPLAEANRNTNLDRAREEFRIGIAAWYAAAARSVPDADSQGD